MAVYSSKVKRTEWQKLPGSEKRGKGISQGTKLQFLALFFFAFQFRFFFQRSSRALTDIHGGVVPVDRRRDARRHLPAMGIWDAADLRPVVGPVVVVVTVVGVGPLGHETTACSVGWWLMAGAGLF
jgi:hypothetical protein